GPRRNIRVRQFIKSPESRSSPVNIDGGPFGGSSPEILNRLTVAGRCFRGRHPHSAVLMLTAAGLRPYAWLRFVSARAVGIGQNPHMRVMQPVIDLVVNRRLVVLFTTVLNPERRAVGDNLSSVLRRSDRGRFLALPRSDVGDRSGRGSTTVNPGLTGAGAAAYVRVEMEAGMKLIGIFAAAALVGAPTALAAQ